MMKIQFKSGLQRHGCVVAERLSAPDSHSGVSDRQSVGLSPSLDTCVFEQDTITVIASPFGWGVKHWPCVLCQCI